MSSNWACSCLCWKSAFLRMCTVGILPWSSGKVVSVECAPSPVCLLTIWIKAILSALSLKQSKAFSADILPVHQGTGVMVCQVLRQERGRRDSIEMEQWWAEFEVEKEGGGHGLEQRNHEFVQGKMACSCVTGACIIMQTSRVGMKVCWHFPILHCLALQLQCSLSKAFYVIINLYRSKLSTRLHGPLCGFVCCRVSLALWQLEVCLCHALCLPIATCL